jgi:hypothetical protein
MVLVTALVSAGCQTIGTGSVQRDLDSKRLMMFLMVFSSLAETGVAPQVPLITIPAR